VTYRTVWPYGTSTASPSRRYTRPFSPLHGAVVALKWLGVGAVYALAVGGPIILLALFVWLVARFVRRRREDALLSRS